MNVCFLNILYFVTGINKYFISSTVKLIRSSIVQNIKHFNHFNLTAKLGVSDQTIIQMHTNYLYSLYDRFQAQPRTHDERLRFEFVSDMQEMCILYVDGEMLWKRLPKFPLSEPMLEMFYDHVIYAIKKLYKTLTEKCFDLDTISILFMVEQFFMNCKFKNALDWFESIVDMPYYQISFPKFSN